MIAPSPAQPSDRTLLVAAQRGDATALGTLIERHFGLIHAVARARLRSPEAAEDLVQEVALRALLNVQRLDPRGNIPAYLARMTRNLAIDWLRRGQPASRLLPMVDLGERDVAELPDSHRKGARDAMATQQEIDALHRALDAMPPDDRELVLMHHAEGLSQRDIAERLGMNQATVSRRMQRALGHLRGRLEPTLRQAAPALRAPRPAAQRTVAMLAVAATLSASAKGTLAAAAAASEPAGLWTAGNVGVGLLTAMAAKAATGGTLMSAGKVTVGLAAVGIVGFMGFKALQPEHTPDVSEAISTTTVQSAATTADPKAVTLSLGLQPGQTWQMDNTIDMAVEVNIPNAPGFPMHFEIGVEGTSTAQVDQALPGGGFQLTERGGQYTLTRSLIEGQPGDVTPYTGVDFARAFNEMVVQWSVDRQGQVVDLNFTGFHVPRNQRFVQELAVAMMSGLPARPVVPGDSWTRDLQIPSLPGARAQCVSTLEAIEENEGQRVAVIRREATLSIPQPLPMDEGEGQILSVDGTIIGEQRLAIDSGQTLGERITWDLTMPMLTTQQTPQGMQTFPMQFRQRITTTSTPRGA